VLECLAHISLAGVTVVAWFGAGSLLLAPVRRTDDRVLDALNRVGIGALAFAIVTFAAGWARLLSAGGYLALFVTAAVAGAAVAAASLRTVAFPRVAAWRPWQIAVAALLAVYVVLAFVATCAPISSPDALLYHAADPALFERAGRIFEIPWNSSSYEPFTVEMLVLDGFLLWDSVQGAFAPLLLALVALAGVIAAGERLSGRSVGLLAGAVFFAQPFMLWETTSVFIEPGLACAVTLSLWNLLAFVRAEQSSALVLAGVFAGSAAGMKYLGIIAALALSAAAVVFLRRRITWRRVLAYALPAVAVPLPWYVKNTVLTGNPVFPHVFGGLNPFAAAELEATMAMFGYGRSPVDFVLLPVRLVADARAFDGGEFISPLFLAFAPLALLLPRLRRPPRAVWIGILLYVVAWFVTTQQARFLVPLMPVVAVLAALGILALAARGRLGRLVAAGATSAALVAGLGISSVYAAQFIPVVFGTESKEEFLRQKVSLYDGVDWLNDHLGANDKVLLHVWSLLYVEVPYVSFGTMGDLLPPDASRNETRSFVARNNVTHIAVLADDDGRRRQVRYLDARLVARVPVQPIRSRTRDERGPTKEMLVYVVARR
jgi:hypothetical protein